MESKTPTLCTHHQTIKSNGHPYVLACSLPPDHEGDHWMRPAHHLVWEEAHHVLMPGAGRMFPKGRVLRPQDGDWTNLVASNWKQSTVARVNKESNSREIGELHNGRRYKTCATCATRKPLNEFPERRNVCKDCFRDTLRDNTQNRREHEAEFGCRLVGKRHYHLGKLGGPIADKQVVLDYWMDAWFTRLNTKSPETYRREVARLRKALNEPEEDNDG